MTLLFYLALSTMEMNNNNLRHWSRYAKKYERKIVNISLSISLNICFCVQKNRLIETVLLSTHNVCFG